MNPAPALLSFAAGLAATILGYGGVVLDLGYEPMTGGRLGYATSLTYDHCYIRITDGLAYYEQQYANDQLSPQNLRFIVAIILHESYHCQSLAAGGQPHNPDCRSIMHAILLHCNDQKLTTDDLLALKADRDRRLPHRVVTLGLSADLPQAPSPMEVIFK